MIDRLRDRRVIVCAGAGGVGKTTTSAALALGLAAEGQRVAVITIDPARRLADALGVAALDNVPHRVATERLAGHGLRSRRAVGDDARSAADVRRAGRAAGATSDRVRDDVLGNRIYQQLAGAVAGSQEYTAIAKLYELDREGRLRRASSSTRRRRATRSTSSTRRSD